MVDIKEQIKIIAKGADTIIEINELENKLIKAHKEGKQLTVKLGLDPTAPDIHLGHAVVLRKIRQIQDLGHKAVIIIGDFTGRIGDPTGKSKTRKPLTEEQVLSNAKTYQDQIFKILDKDKTELKFNSEWLSKLNFRDVIELCSKYTVARMLEREDFKNRFSLHQSIGIHEFFYPLMQAYDSIAINADIEFGGTDQRFNILMGRTLQKDYGLESQIAIFMPILEGIDGVDKMSKSLGNYIGIYEEPQEMFVKVMQIPDNMIIKYFNLCTDIHPDEINRIEQELNSNNTNPRDIKIRLAREIVTLYHDENKALKAEEYFVQVYTNRNTPDNIPQVVIDERFEENNSVDMVSVIWSLNMVSSKSEIRRLIEQGGVKINGDKLIDFKNSNIKNGDILQIGKNKFAKLIRNK
ncbi:tyrosyl-tRNA synthetase [Clostridium tetanomorphum]|uniref:Tyrosine--tRNA ligase n=1 Tax=Clostridium tetanomorphum TaxID=1553 RepID=A0A923E841_CLOTT|nr:tyrosine--tRNA ligase [Clostridium tetanomorphum]KAJ49186.1 tyrosyl-tRNA ligase [Clostridium tetanomorphum DSM 665]KAJ50507.1 tyrosyl-tRNA ligase [Clostridium tetanomorphum DSM 665]MBC2398297.1 tyrosine--tRNA ligase [Clostridium tetanomorphum]MBP1865585.1 tyrosyl-tRNA synthetase [Clostridium tetanomorphum]NRS85909.1 tyrosyl-tRNA synthetase [Clostridium tetanomorphum]